MTGAEVMATVFVVALYFAGTLERAGLLLAQPRFTPRMLSSTQPASASPRVALRLALQHSRVYLSEMLRSIP